MSDTNSNSPSIPNKTTLLRSTTYVLTGLTLFVVIGLYAFTSSNMVSLQAMSQERVAIQEDLLANQGLAEFVTNNRDSLQSLGEVFPNQETIVFFLQDLEQVVHSTDPSGTVRFAALNPAQHNSQLSIPITITTRTPIPDAISLMRRIEKMPYLITIRSVDIHSPLGHQQPATVTIGGRVYVQDPFTQP